MHENMNVFKGNQDYFHPFIEPGRVGVVPFRRDRTGDRCLCYASRYTQDLDSVWGSDDKAEVEPPRAKAPGSSTCFEGGTLRSTPHYAPQELRRVPSSHSSTV
jgi:hypothetical protein